MSGSSGTLNGRAACAIDMAGLPCLVALPDGSQTNPDSAEAEDNRHNDLRAELRRGRFGGGLTVGGELKEASIDGSVSACRHDKCKCKHKAEIRTG